MKLIFIFINHPNFIKLPIFFFNSISINACFIPVIFYIRFILSINEFIIYYYHKFLTWGPHVFKFVAGPFKKKKVAHPWSISFNENDASPKEKKFRIVADKRSAPIRRISHGLVSMSLFRAATLASTFVWGLPFLNS